MPIQKVPIKSTDKKVPIKSTDKKVPIKTKRQKDIILEFIRENQNIKSADLLEVLNVKEERIKKLLQQLIADGFIISEGGNRNRTYKLSPQPKK